MSKQTEDSEQSEPLLGFAASPGSGTFCACCGRKRSDERTDYCPDCWDEVVLPAYHHVESVKPDDSARQMWHGWALREAFIAGATSQMQLRAENEILRRQVQQMGARIYLLSETAEDLSTQLEPMHRRGWWHEQAGGFFVRIGAAFANGKSPNGQS